MPSFRFAPRSLRYHRGFRVGNPFKKKAKDEGRNSRSDSSPGHPSDTPSQPRASKPAPTTVQFVLHRNVKTVQRLRTARDRGLEAWRKKTKENNEDTMGERQIRGGMRQIHEIGRISTENLLKLMKDEDDSDSFSLYNAGPARPVEIPEEEVLLFSARPRPLRPVGVHQDVNQANNFLTWMATYKETVKPSHDGEMRGVKPGTLVQTCKLHYYPHDRSCRVVDPRWDENAGSDVAGEGLPRRFRNARAKGLKASANGEGRDMAVEDFSYAPKSGAPGGYVYRMSMWRKPLVKVMGVTFEVHDGEMFDIKKVDGSANEVRRSDEQSTA